MNRREFLQLLAAAAAAGTPLDRVAGAPRPPGAAPARPAFGKRTPWGFP